MYPAKCSKGTQGISVAVVSAAAALAACGLCLPGCRRGESEQPSATSTSKYNSYTEADVQVLLKEISEMIRTCDPRKVIKEEDARSETYSVQIGREILHVKEYSPHSPTYVTRYRSLKTVDAETGATIVEFSSEYSKRLDDRESSRKPPETFTMMGAILDTLRGMRSHYHEAQAQPTLEKLFAALTHTNPEDAENVVRVKTSPDNRQKSIQVEIGGLRISLSKTSAISLGIEISRYNGDLSSVNPDKEAGYYEVLGAARVLGLDETITDSKPAVIPLLPEDAKRLFTFFSRDL